MSKETFILDTDGTEMDSRKLYERTTEYRRYHQILSSYNKKKHAMPKDRYKKTIRAFEEHIAFGTPISFLAHTHMVDTSLLHTMKYLYSPIATWQ
jgi:hypothetical protein